MNFFPKITPIERFRRVGTGMIFVVKVTDDMPHPPSLLGGIIETDGELYRVDSLETSSGRVEPGVTVGLVVSKITRLGAPKTTSRICLNQSREGFKSSVEQAAFIKIVQLLSDPNGKSFVVEFDRERDPENYFGDFVTVTFKQTTPIPSQQ